jgi:predicted dehydrogenase
MHGEHTIKCAGHGAHVLCEKPIEITREKIDSMINVCGKGGFAWGIYQRRTYSGAIAAKKAIEDGQIGKLILCDGYFKYHRSQEYYDSDSWRAHGALTAAVRL